MINDTDNSRNKMATGADDCGDSNSNVLMSTLLDDAIKERDNRVSPTLDECIQQVVCTNGSRLKAINGLKYKMAASFTNLLMERMMASCPSWRRYVAKPNRSEKTAVLFKEDFGSFVCHVHLRRPTRLSPFVVSGLKCTLALYGLVVYYRGMGERMTKHFDSYSRMEEDLIIIASKVTSVICTRLSGLTCLVLRQSKLAKSL